jgi:hypothetical protein
MDRTAMAVILADFDSAIAQIRRARAEVGQPLTMPQLTE